MTDPIIETSKAMFAAFASGDRAAAERLLHPEFTFTSPLDNRIDRQAYFERCWPGSANAAGFEFIHVARAGEVVFVSYLGRWTNGKAGRNTELITVRDGQVVGVEVFFGWDMPHKAGDGESAAG